MIRRFTVLLAAALVAGGCQTPQPRPDADGALGITWPGRTPELFAAGVVNTDGIEINLVFNRAYTEVFFARSTDRAFSIYASRRGPDGWTTPEELQMFPEGAGGEAVDMALSPDERSLYFLGITPREPGSEEKDTDIWVSDRTDTGWSLARRVPAPISTEHAEIYPVLTADGSLWFVSDRPGGNGPRDLYRARPRPDGGFDPPVSLDAPINTELSKGDTFVAPDESYIILSSRRPGGHGSGDLYVSFRGDDGGWTEPKNMGPLINTPEIEFCPMVSPDGRWLSFSRRYGDTWDTTTDAEIYWMDASIIEDMRGR
jgi:hypothetical protein